MKKNKINWQTSPDPLFETISSFLSSVNCGAITIDIGEQPFLKLTLNQGDINKINLEFGQKFIEILLEVGMKTISDKEP
jgi:hypothetical protein